jgi:hypothetical protein
VRLYSYIVVHDTGFSPNPFHGVCTLACCKPVIRRTARIGDLVVGLSPRGERFVYAMQVGRVLDFAQYWRDPQYSAKRPDRDAPGAASRRGDNIYEPCAIGEFRQVPSSHSHPDGTERIETKRTDLGGEHVLVADRYTYFGGDGPPVPKELAFLKTGRGHRSRFTPEQVARVAEWFASLPAGVHGRPARWPPDDTSWRER